VVDGKQTILHLIPSGILHPGKRWTSSRPRASTSALSGS
jgi:adenylosuccinate synthase